jgi:hypothetical protein
VTNAISLLTELCRKPAEEIAPGIWFKIGDWSRHNDLTIMSGLAPSGSWFRVGEIVISVKNGVLKAIVKTVKVKQMFYYKMSEYDVVYFDCSNPAFPNDLFEYAKRAAINYRRVHNLKNRRAWRKLRSK